MNLGILPLIACEVAAMDCRRQGDYAAKWAGNSRHEVFKQRYGKYYGAANKKQAAKRRAKNKQASKSRKRNRK